MKHNDKLLTEVAFNFIEKSIDIIDRDDWMIFESKINYELTPMAISLVYEMLYHSGVNPLINLNYIPKNMFYCRDDILKFEIPNDTVCIEDQAFYCCVNLKELIIPESLNSIGRFAFDRCPKLNKIYFKGNHDPLFLHPILENNGGGFIYFGDNFQNCVEVSVEEDLYLPF